MCRVKSVFSSISQVSEQVPSFAVSNTFTGWGCLCLWVSTVTFAIWMFPIRASPPLRPQCSRLDNWNLFFCGQNCSLLLPLFSVWHRPMARPSLIFFFQCSLPHFFDWLWLNCILTVRVEQCLLCPYEQRPLPSNLLRFLVSLCTHAYWYPNKIHLTPCIVNSG